MPHGLSIDTEGNYWLTHVAMHQVDQLMLLCQMMVQLSM